MLLFQTSQILSLEIARMQNLLRSSKEMEDQLDAALQIYRGLHLALIPIDLWISLLNFREIGRSME